MEGRICRRCLLKELSEESFLSIYEYIENLPQELKTPEHEYEKRIAICKACTHLINGMCDYCGCFAEVRAAKKNQSCPDMPAKW